MADPPAHMGGSDGQTDDIDLTGTFRNMISTFQLNDRILTCENGNGLPCLTALQVGNCETCNCQDNSKCYSDLITRITSSSSFKDPFSVIVISSLRKKSKKRSAKNSPNSVSENQSSKTRRISNSPTQQTTPSGRVNTQGVINPVTLSTRLGNPDPPPAASLPAEIIQPRGSESRPAEQAATPARQPVDLQGRRNPPPRTEGNANQRAPKPYIKELVVNFTCPNPQLSANQVFDFLQELSKLNGLNGDKYEASLHGNIACIRPYDEETLTKLMQVQQVGDFNVEIVPRNRQKKCFYMHCFVDTRHDIKTTAIKPMGGDEAHVTIERATRVTHTNRDTNVTYDTRRVNFTAYGNKPPQYVKVGFERVAALQTEKELRMCSKCNGFGHAARNCKRRKPRCGNCAEDHYTKQCKIDKKDFGQLKCPNCDEKHSARYGGCRERLRIIDDLQKVNTQAANIKNTTTTSNHANIHITPPSTSTQNNTQHTQNNQTLFSQIVATTRNTLSNATNEPSLSDEIKALKKELIDLKMENARLHSQLANYISDKTCCHRQTQSGNIPETNANPLREPRDTMTSSNEETPVTPPVAPPANDAVGIPPVATVSKDSPTLQGINSSTEGQQQLLPASTDVIEDPATQHTTQQQQQQQQQNISNTTHMQTPNTSIIEHITYFQQSFEMLIRSQQHQFHEFLNRLNNHYGF